MGPDELNNKTMEFGIDEDDFDLWQEKLHGEVDGAIVKCKMKE